MLKTTSRYCINKHYCSSSMPRLSQTRRFLQSPSLQQAQSALIAQLTQCIVIGRTPQAHDGNVMTLTIFPSFNFQISFISSSPKGEQGKYVSSRWDIFVAIAKNTFYESKVIVLLFLFCQKSLGH